MYNCLGNPIFLGTLSKAYAICFSFSHTTVILKYGPFAHSSDEFMYVQFSMNLLKKINKQINFASSNDYHGYLWICIHFHNKNDIPTTVSLTNGRTPAISIWTKIHCFLRQSDKKVKHYSRPWPFQNSLSNKP